MGAVERAAVELVGDPERPGPFVITCEHASNALPDWIVAEASDQALLADHWGWDIGARDVTLALVERLGGQAVLSSFSRLVADTNRDPVDPTYIVRMVDGRPVSFNQRLDDAEVARRTRQLFDAYHAAIDKAIGSRVAIGAIVHLLGVHSFTPLYLGTPRTMEIGVLFDDYDAEAWNLQRALCAQGFDAVLNAPYSGKSPSGLIYAARRHGRGHGIKYLELEINQDLIRTPDTARLVAARIAVALEVFRP
jgi:predicted N-formylglutamate amidohydrolase